MDSSLSSVTILLSFCGGVALWPMLEYLLHHYLGHKGRGKNIFSKEHLKHHAEKDLFSPAYKKIAAAIPVVGSVFLIMNFILSSINAKVCLANNNPATIAL